MDILRPQDFDAMVPPAAGVPNVRDNEPVPQVDITTGAPPTQVQDTSYLEGNVPATKVPSQEISGPIPERGDLQESFGADRKQRVDFGKIWDVVQYESALGLGWNKRHLMGETLNAKIRQRQLQNQFSPDEEKVSDYDIAMSIANSGKWGSIGDRVKTALAEGNDPRDILETIKDKFKFHEPQTRDYYDNLLGFYAVEVINDAEKKKHSADTIVQSMIRDPRWVHIGNEIKSQLSKTQSAKATLDYIKNKYKPSADKNELDTFESLIASPMAMAWDLPLLIPATIGIGAMGTAMTGNPVTGSIGGIAGGMAFLEGYKARIRNEISNGNITDTKSFMEAMKAIAPEMGKGAVVGAVGGGAGATVKALLLKKGAVPMVEILTSKGPKMIPAFTGVQDGLATAAEIEGFTIAQAALDKRMPKVEDLLTATTAIVGIKLAHKASSIVYSKIRRGASADSALKEMNSLRNLSDADKEKELNRRIKDDPYITEKYEELNKRLYGQTLREQLIEQGYDPDEILYKDASDIFEPTDFSGSNINEPRERAKFIPANEPASMLPTEILGSNRPLTEIERAELLKKGIFKPKSQVTGLQKEMGVETRLDESMKRRVIEEESSEVFLDETFNEKIKTGDAPSERLGEPVDVVEGIADGNPYGDITSPRTDFRYPDTIIDPETGMMVSEVEQNTANAMRAFADRAGRIAPGEPMIIGEVFYDPKEIIRLEQLLNTDPRKLSRQDLIMLYEKWDSAKQKESFARNAIDRLMLDYGNRSLLKKIFDDVDRQVKSDEYKQRLGDPLVEVGKRADSIIAAIKDSIARDNLNTTKMQEFGQKLTDEARRQLLEIANRKETILAVAFLAGIDQDEDGNYFWNPAKGIPAGSMAMFVGVRWRFPTNQLMRLKEAEAIYKNLGITKLTEANKDIVNKVRIATGWHIEVDGKYRYEISDKEAKVKEDFLKSWLGRTNSDLHKWVGKTVKLGDIFEAKELYDYDPSLADVNVEFVSGTRYSMAVTSHETIKVNVEINSFNKQFRTNLLHEIQHIVQWKEGWSLNPLKTAKMALDNFDKILRDINRLETSPLEHWDKDTSIRLRESAYKINEMMGRISRASEEYAGIEREEAKSGETEWSKTTKESLRQFMDTMKKDLDKESEALTFAVYRIFQHETESRITSMRADLTKEQRILKAPWEENETRIGDRYDAGRSPVITVPPESTIKSETKEEVQTSGKEEVNLGFLGGDKFQRVWDRFFNKNTPLTPEEQNILNQARKGKKILPDTAEGVDKMHQIADKVLAEEEKTSVDSVRRVVERWLVDVSGNIKADLEKLGPIGHKARVMRELIAGAPAKVGMILDSCHDDIYSKLSHEEVKALNNIIESRRIVQIDRYRTGVQHPLGPTGRGHQQWLNDLQDKVSPEVYNKLTERADKFFNVMRSQLTELYDNGLVSKPVYEKLKNLDYSPREYLEHIDPDIPQYRDGKRISVKDSGIKPLDQGSMDILEKDSYMLLAHVVTRTQGRIFKNKANQELYKLALDQPDNGVVRLTIKDTLDKMLKDKQITAREHKNLVDQDSPTNWDRVYVWVEGQQYEMSMPREAVKEWVTADPFLNHTFAQVLRWVSGSAPLKAMATGYNPVFALTNLPRDLALTWAATDQYSSFLPKALLQQAGKLGKSFVDSCLRKGEYIDYINEGGGIELLTHYGRFDTESKVGARVDEVTKTLGYIGETSEIISRLALRKQAIENLTNKFIKENERLPNTKEKKDIQIEATWEARNYLDFNQGGSATKAADTVIPYLNASVQAGRSLVQALRKNPAMGMYKIAQIMTASSLVWWASYNINPEGQRQISDIDRANNFCIVLPEAFSYTDNNNNKRHLYIKIAKDQGMQAVCSFAEALFDKYYNGRVPKEQLYESLSNFIQTQLLPPSYSAYLTYALNKDFWTMEDAWKGNPKTEPKEQWQPGIDNPLAVGIGEATGLSPRRLSSAAQRVIPASNAFVSAGLGTIKVLVGDTLSEMEKKSVKQNVLEVPAIRRVLSQTHPFTEFKHISEQTKTELATEITIRNRTLDTLTKAWLETGNPAAEGKLEAFIDSSPQEHQKSMRNRVKNMERLKDVPNRIWWVDLMQIQEPEKRAEYYFNRFKDANQKEKEQMDDVSTSIHGIRSKRFNRRLNDLEAEYGEKQI